MSEWKTVSLGEKAKEITVGFVGPMASEYVEKGIPFLRSQNVIPFSIDYNGIKYISEEFHKKLKKSALVPGDVVIVRTGKPGASVVIPKSLPIANCSDLVIVRCGDELDPDFISYFINSITKSHVDANLVGAVQQHFNVGAAKQILIPDINLIHQRTIASVLSSLDDKIDLLQRQNATLEKMAETLFRQWFVEEAKEEWEEKKLGEILTITSSKRIFYSEYISYGVPFYRSKEIIELRNTGATKSELYISSERYNEINSKFGSPKAGDILMTSVGTLGVAYRVKSSDNFYFKDGNLTWFKDFKEIPSSIIYLWLISKIGQEELAAITIGSTQQALTIEGLKSISFKVPPREIIDKCATEFDSIILKMDSNQTQIRTLTTLRDTLLPKLMNGEVRVVSMDAGPGSGSGG